MGDRVEYKRPDLTGSEFARVYDHKQVAESLLFMSLTGALVAFEQGHERVMQIALFIAVLSGPWLVWLHHRYGSVDKGHPERERLKAGMSSRRFVVLPTDGPWRRFVLRSKEFFDWDLPEDAAGGSARLLIAVLFAAASVWYVLVGFPAGAPVFGLGAAVLGIVGGLRHKHRWWLAASLWLVAAVGVVASTVPLVYVLTPLQFPTI